MMKSKWKMIHLIHFQEQANQRIQPKLQLNMVKTHEMKPYVGLYDTITYYV